MVHALHEAWRVLKPLGVIIDLRPISVYVPLFILTGATWKSAGLIDGTQLRGDDVAANRAIQSAVHDQLLTKLKREYFKVNFYWNDLKELKIDVDGRWKEDFTISKEIWRKARILSKKGGSQSRVRVPLRLKIAKYQKKEL